MIEIIPKMSARSLKINGSNVKFGERINEDEDEVQNMPRHTATMPIKAIPVIALVAMSPITSVNNAYAKDNEDMSKVVMVQPQRAVSDKTFVVMPNKTSIPEVNTVSTQQIPVTHPQEYITFPKNWDILKRININEG